MGEVLGIVSGLSCTQLEEYSSEAGVSFRNVASGCRVKRVATNDGYSYFFAKKCTSKRGLAVIYPKLRRYHLVDLVVKHECEMVSISYKFSRTGCCSSKLQSTATSCQNRLDIMYQGVGMLSFNNYS